MTPTEQPYSAPQDTDFEAEQAYLVEWRERLSIAARDNRSPTRGEFEQIMLEMLYLMKTDRSRTPRSRS